MMDKKKCTSKKVVDSFFIKMEVHCIHEEGHVGPHEKITLANHYKWWKEDEKTT